MPNTGTLPLRCTVCPRKPSFSDVSHLLTHIGSKAHLSHYYKLRVRSVQDSVAARDLALFDAWYTSNNVEDLMSARLSDKERKKTRTKAQALAQTSKVRKTTQGRLSIDPRLEVADFASLPGEFDPPNSLRASETGWQAHQPQLHLWSTQLPSSFTALPTHNSSPLTPSRFSDETVSHDSVSLDTGDWLNSDEATRLKGAVWPGMDVFDSATEGMRKKRNQRKDISVVARLERHSLDVQPVEVIHFPFGHIRKEKIITGKPDNESSSPIQGVLSPLTPPQARRPLADRSINTPGLLTDHGTPSNLPLITREGDCKGPQRSFPVFHDGQNDEGDGPNMAILTSSFDPIGQQTVALPSELVHPNIQLPLWTPASEDGQATFFPGSSLNRDASFALQDQAQPHNQFCVPGQYNYWGSQGYDLNGFLGANISQTYSPQEIIFEDTAQLEASGSGLQDVNHAQYTQEGHTDSRYNDPQEPDIFIDFESHHDGLEHHYSPPLRS